MLILRKGANSLQTKFESPIFQPRNSIWQPKFIAHRGYTPEAPENSIPAFRAAGMRRFWAIEADVYRTVDGVLVCHHDLTIDRMYDGTGEVSGKTWAELQTYTIDAGNNLDQYSADMLKMPTFEQYLEICRYYGSVPFIEIKAASVEKVIDTVRQFGMEEATVISSSKLQHLREVRSITDRIFIHHIFSSMELAPELAELGNAGLSLNYPDVTQAPEGDIKQLHRMGLKVCLRAGDREQDARRMLELGLDYIPTNILFQLSI